MSYTCEKVNTVSSEIAESFWTAGESYYITERTLPKYTGSDRSTEAIRPLRRIGRVLAGDSRPQPARPAPSGPRRPRA